MKLLTSCVLLSLGILSAPAYAEVMVTVDGEEIAFSVLMETCKSMTGDAEAKLACFNSLSAHIDNQTDATPEDTELVAQTFENLQAVAQYHSDETGLSITGTDCSVTFSYFANYFHTSRRNVSTIDIFSVEFDASQIQSDQINEIRGGQTPLFSGLMSDNGTAVIRGGAAMDSAEHDFAPKSARMTLDAYADTVLDQLPAKEDQAFEFVLVHPNRSAASADILAAFTDFVAACQP